MWCRAKRLIGGKERRGVVGDGRTRRNSDERNRDSAFGLAFVFRTAGNPAADAQ